MIAIGHTLRHKKAAGEEKRKRESRELIHVTRQILGDAGRVLTKLSDL